jgi:hypothetical protein
MTRSARNSFRARLATLAVPLLAASVLTAARQDAPPAEPAPALEPPYPSERPATALHAFSLQGEVDVAKFEKAMAKQLGDEARLVRPPAKVPGRGSIVFLSIEAPADVKVRAVAQVVKKFGKKVEPMRWTILAWDTDETETTGERGRPNAGREWILGMDADLRWYDRAHGQAIFYYEQRKLDAPTLLERMQRAAEDFERPMPGARVLRESFTWPLVLPVAEKEARKAERAIRRLTGVESVSIEADTGRLHATLALGDQDRSGPPLRAPDWPAEEEEEEPADPDAEPPPEPRPPPWRPRFDVRPLFEALEKAGIGVQGAKKPR